jgi:hypothetical protein
MRSNDSRYMNFLDSNDYFLDWSSTTSHFQNLPITSTNELYSSDSLMSEVQLMEYSMITPQLVMYAETSVYLFI